MKVSAKGMVIAGATAAAVLIAGWVFVFGAQESREVATAKAAGAAADEASQTLEQRRQARLAQSQAMLGGGKPVPPEPTEAAPAPAAEGSAPPAAPVPERNPRPAATPVIAPLAPPPEQPCQVATTGSSLVAEACRRGGRPEAKQVMKRLVADARERGARYTCESCHADLDNYLLREDARAEFNALLENTR